MASRHALQQITAPSFYPVTVAQVKEHLRIDFSDQDSDIELKLAAAVEWVEDFTGRALIDQTWDVYYDAFPDDDGAIEIPKPPLIEVLGVFYDDADGAEQQISSANYYVDTVSSLQGLGWVLPISTFSWPTPLDAVNAVRVRFKAGYVTSDSPNAGEVPAKIKLAILAYVGTFFKQRETVGPSEMEYQVFDALLRQHRVHLGMA